MKALPWHKNRPLLERLSDIEKWLISVQRRVIAGDIKEAISVLENDRASTERLHRIWCGVLRDDAVPAHDIIFEFGRRVARRVKS